MVTRSLFASLLAKKKPTADDVATDTLANITENQTGVTPPINQETGEQGELENIAADVHTSSPLVNSSPRPQPTPSDA